MAAVAAAAAAARAGPLLLASLVLALLLAPTSADVRPVPTRPGLFYIFMSGQVAVLDAGTSTVVKSIRTFKGAAAQVPNSCPGNPLQGTWNAAEVGVRSHTIFATMTFAQQGAMRQPGLSDGVVVINCTTQEIEAVVPIAGQPSSITPVPQDESVWVHTDNNGAQTVLSISPDYQVQEVDIGAKTNVAVAGTLLADTAMGTKGYMTSYGSSGVYVYDMFGRTGANFINFQTFQVAHHSWLTQRGVYCPATSQAVYAPTSRRVFVACTRVLAASGGVVTRGATPGVVEMSSDTDLPVDAWPHVQADKLYLTPDESLVVAVNEDAAVINFIQPLPGVNSDQTMSTIWPNITLPAGSHPDQIAFYPTGRFFKAVVSLLRSTYTAVIDFNVLIPCGQNCPAARVQSALELINSGYQVPPGVITATVNSRPVAVGHHFFCVDVASTSSLFCHNFLQPAANKVYRRMANVDQLMFVEGPYYGDESLIPAQTQGRGIDTVFNCAAQ